MTIKNFEARKYFFIFTEDRGTAFSFFWYICNVPALVVPALVVPALVVPGVDMQASPVLHLVSWVKGLLKK